MAEAVCPVCGSTIEVEPCPTCEATEKCGVPNAVKGESPDFNGLPCILAKGHEGKHRDRHWWEYTDEANRLWRQVKASEWGERAETARARRREGEAVGILRAIVEAGERRDQLIQRAREVLAKIDADVAAEEAGR